MHYSEIGGANMVNLHLIVKRLQAEGDCRRREIDRGMEIRHGERWRQKRGRQSHLGTAQRSRRRWGEAASEWASEQTSVLENHSAALDSLWKQTAETQSSSPQVTAAVFIHRDDKKTTEQQSTSVIGYISYLLFQYQSERRFHKGGLCIYEHIDEQQV